MFLKDKSKKWSTLLMMLGTQNLTYKETADAIETFQTKIDLAEASNSNVAYTISDKKNDDEHEWYKSFYTNNHKGGKGSGDLYARG